MTAECHSAAPRDGRPLLRVAAFSDKHNGVEIQAYCAMIVCMLILIHTGEKPNRAMYQMVWYYLIGLASLKGLEAFIKSRKQPVSA